MRYIYIIKNLRTGLIVKREKKIIQTIRKLSNFRKYGNHSLPHAS